ncbi:MAG: hypothetical protein U5J63_06025 [Fodinibius sp.]|nr:hypothetical protein [Fodinibius sp.]
MSVDSLMLKNGNVLGSGRQWESSQPKAMRWTLPNGEIPVGLYLSARQSVNGDSVRTISQQVPLGNIPVRYDQNSQQ